MKIIFTCIIISLLAARCSTGQSETRNHISGDTIQNTNLSVENMRSDLAILWSAIKEVHPGYGTYTSPDSLEKKYEATRAALDTPMSETEYISHVYPFLCDLGCGHTQISHSATYRPPAIHKATHLPFDVLVHQNRAWVTTRQTSVLSTGDEIISINGIPASSIIQKGYSLYCGDGHVGSFKELYLSEYEGFEDACNAFYHWTFPYQMEVRTGSGKNKHIILHASDTAKIDNGKPGDKYVKWTKVEETGDLGLYFYKKKPIALLEVRELVYADTSMYGKCFEKIAGKGTKDLILDMRHNGGGDIRIAIRLMSYLATSDFGIIRDLYGRLPDPSVNSDSTYFDAEKTANFKSICLPAQPTRSATPNEVGKTHYHMDVRPAFGRVYQPIPVANTHRFTGKLIVLIDGATFSSAALFVSALKAQRNNVTFVGRETAGTEEGCNGFAMQKLTLPASHIVVEFPWLRVVSMAASPVHGRGLFPDHQVNYTPQEVVAEYDADLAKALTLVSDHQPAN
jgi:hypothetical protein